MRHRHEAPEAPVFRVVRVTSTYRKRELSDGARGLLTVCYGLLVIGSFFMYESFLRDVRPGFGFEPEKPIAEEATRTAAPIPPRHPISPSQKKPSAAALLRAWQPPREKEIGAAVKSYWAEKLSSCRGYSDTSFAMIHTQDPGAWPAATLGLPVSLRPEDFRAFRGAKPTWKAIKLSPEDKEANYEWRVTTTLTVSAEGFYNRGAWEYQDDSGRRQHETLYSTVLEKAKGEPWKARDQEMTINAPKYLKPMPCALVARYSGTQEARQ